MKRDNLLNLCLVFLRHPIVIDVSIKSSHFYMYFDQQFNIKMWQKHSHKAMILHTTELDVGACLPICVIARNILDQKLPILSLMGK